MLGGGAHGSGTIFKLNTDGTAFTTLYSFSAAQDGTNNDGSGPGGAKVWLGNRLYGTTYSGGTGGSGTIFAINTDGSGFTNLYNFSGNEDGASPGDLVLVSNRLYGTAQTGGSSSAGTVFTIGVDGSGFKVLRTFTNADGNQPYPGLIASGNTLYGTTYWGGSSWPNPSSGTIFSLNTDGTSFQSLYSFSEMAQGTNSEGCCPQGELILVGKTLFGTASYGGPNGIGTIFSVNTDGTGFTNLYSFSADSGSPSYTNSDGGTPAGLLVFSAGTFYGTTVDRGPFGDGTIYSLSLGGATVTQLGIASVGSNLVLTWPAGATGYVLQSATTLANGGDWQDSTLIPNQTNAQNSVSIKASSAVGFFRLRHP